MSKSRCNRCPIRMLKEGTLPDGYTVKRRKLVKTTPLVKTDKKTAQKIVAKASKKSKKNKLAKRPIAA